MMDVKLWESTPRPELQITSAANMCYSDGAKRFFSNEDCARMIAHLLRDRHLSPFEHASITYQVSGISRACSHQLVRHRIASYTQQSQRYVTLDEEPDWVVPPSLTDEELTLYEYRGGLGLAFDSYKRLIEWGYPAEDARYILPNATPTNIVVTMNFRELLHFFELRCCKRAQWEIRELANRMRELAREIAPNVFKDAGPKCAECEQECPE